MIQLLFTVLVAEMGFTMTLLFGNPIRNLMVKGVDRLKQGRGLIVTNTVGATMMVVFISTIYNITRVQKRLKDGGVLNPTDEVLTANSLLEASLMGYFLFLALIIDRLHNYIREINILRKELEAAKKLNHSHQQLKGQGGGPDAEKPKVQ